MTTDFSYTFLDFNADRRPRAATIGFFDGVHTGHRHLLRRLCADAAERDLAPIAITFDVHPRRVLKADFRPALLQTTDEKLAALAESGLSGVAILHFTPEMAALTARDFMEALLLRRMEARYLLVGYDHHFGRPVEGVETDYEALGRETGLEVHLCDPVRLDGLTVSSSAIRRLLDNGDAGRAAYLLGRPHTLAGTVVKGRQIGRRLGFPTANLQPARPDQLVPAAGVYAAEAETQGKRYVAMVNIGRRPTLNNGTDTTIEAHLLDFDADLYGSKLRLHFVNRLRDERRFASTDALVEQIRIDRQAVQNALRHFCQ